MRPQRHALKGLALLSGLVPFLAFPCYFLFWFTFQSPAQGKESGEAAFDERVYAVFQDYLAAEAPAVYPSVEPNVEREPDRNSRVVHATAYNAVEGQTDSTPKVCAWGDRIKPGVVAVSRDLERLGLTRGQEVYIEGLGKLVVLDRTNSNRKNQIDIYMESYTQAVSFGVQDVEIRWEVSLADSMGAKEKKS
jgi:3D (Asp-Asp-Asp) domain-containing protein